MATNAYLERLSQLDAKKEQTLASKVGLPLNRPLNKQTSGLAGNPNPQQEENNEGAPQMDTPFAMNLENFKSQDTRFDQMMKEYTRLAEGMGQAVRQGYMPEVIAKQRLASYLTDSQKYFGSNKATPMDNPEVAGMIEQFLMQASQGQGQEPIQDPNAPQGAPQGQPQIPPQGGM